MSKFIKLSVSEILSNKEKNIIVRLVKFQKEGTKRIFFAPEVEGKRITTTMFARLSGARDLAKQYIKLAENHNKICK